MFPCDRTKFGQKQSKLWFKLRAHQTIGLRRTEINAFDFDYILISIILGYRLYLDLASIVLVWAIKSNKKKETELSYDKFYDSNRSLCCHFNTNDSVNMLSFRSTQFHYFAFFDSMIDKQIRFGFVIHC